MMRAKLLPVHTNTTWVQVLLLVSLGLSACTVSIGAEPQIYWAKICHTQFPVKGCAAAPPAARDRGPAGKATSTDTSEIDDPEPPASVSPPVPTAPQPESSRPPPPSPARGASFKHSPVVKTEPRRSSQSTEPSSAARPSRQVPSSGLANGVGCKFSSDCASKDCSFGVCTGRDANGNKALGNGVACKFSSDCASKDCSFGVCQGRDADGNKALGEGVACKFSSDCASKDCSFGVCAKRRSGW
jgi:hypothetical protein